MSSGKRPRKPLPPVDDISDARGFQSLINIGMNVRLLPVIGITLPFFSRGGSSLATLFLGIGVALSVYHSSHLSTRDTIFSKRMM